MIEKETLIKLAKLNGMKPWQQEKHYIQALLLTILADKEVVFKGGTYLWFFHGLPRFSEDLDFTLVGKPFSVKELSESLELWGIEHTVRVVKDNKSSLSFRVGVKGPLYTSEKDICYVYVDISKRERVVDPVIVYKLDFPSYNLPIKFLKGLSLEEVAAEKVRAIMTRERARDIYDLFYLIAHKGVKYKRELIEEKLRYYKMSFSKNTFVKAVNAHKPYYAAELKSLLFTELPSFDEVTRVLTRWVR